MPDPAPFAKALFRATKPRARRTAAQGELDTGTPAPPPTEARRPLDFYPTVQPDPIRALLAADGHILRTLGAAWEPAAGRGDLAREMRAEGLTVHCSDIADHGCAGVELRDFYAFDHAPAPAIVTNPPFNEITARDGHGRWLRHTLALPGWRYCALLLSWDWPAGRVNGLGDLLDRHPFSWCYLMRWKIDFTGQGQAPQRNAWFVWDRDDPRDTTTRHPDFRFLDRIDPRQGGLDL